MFNELRDHDNRRTIVSYVFMLTCIAVTTGSLVFTNLQNVFGDLEGTVPLSRQFTFIFYHGFDQTSAILHLCINLYFFIVIGTTVEKVLGSFRFLAVMGVACLVYGLSVHQLGLFGPAATGILWTLAPISAVILLEGRRIKTRSMYEEQYSFTRLNLIILVTVLPLFIIFLQFFLRGHISNLEAIYHGLVPCLISLALGVGIASFFRQHIKERLKSFGRRKKLDPGQYDILAQYGSLAFPFYIFLVLYLYKYL